MRIGSPAYGPYLDRAVTEGNLALLGWDCYAQMWEGDSGWNVYFNNRINQGTVPRLSPIKPPAGEGVL